MKTFAKTFLDVTIKGDKVNEGLLMDCQAYASSIPKTIDQQCYQTSRFECISNFEEDSNLTTATMENAKIRTSKMKEWKEIRMVYGNGQSKENYCLFATWENTKDAQITFMTPKLNLSERSIVFDLADMEESKNPKVLIDGTVSIRDIVGHTASVQISDYAIVFPSLPVQLGKLDYVFGNYEYKHQFQTVTIPDKAFNNSSIDMNRIVEITIAIDSKESGEIKLDNVGLE